CGKLSDGTNRLNITSDDIKPPVTGTAKGRIMLSNARRVAVTPWATRVERFLRLMRRARSCDARTRSWVASVAGTRGCAMSRRLARIDCMDSNRSPHLPHASKCANTYSRSAAGRLQSSSKEIRSCTFSQLIASLCRLGYQSRGQTWLQASHELFPQGLAAAQDSGFHCSQRNAEDFRDFLVSQVRDVSQRHGFPEDRVDSLQRRLNHHVLFAIERLIEWRTAAIWNNLLPTTGLIRILVQFHFRPAMPEEPAARVVGFIHRNLVDPRFQCALDAEGAHVPEDLQKHFLHHVAGLALVVQQAQSECVHRLLEADQQLLVGPFGTVAQGFHQVEVGQVHRFRRLARAQIENGSAHGEPHIQPDLTVSGKSPPCKVVDTLVAEKVPGWAKF